MSDFPVFSHSWCMYRTSYITNAYCPFEAVARIVKSQVAHVITSKVGHVIIRTPPDDMWSFFVSIIVTHCTVCTLLKRIPLSHPSSLYKADLLYNYFLNTLHLFTFPYRLCIPLKSEFQYIGQLPPPPKSHDLPRDSYISPIKPILEVFSAFTQHYLEVVTIRFEESWRRKKIHRNRM